jgi:hypothetical protein
MITWGRIKEARFYTRPIETRGFYSPIRKEEEKKSEKS